MPPDSLPQPFPHVGRRRITVARAERRLRAAMLRGDVAALDRLLADDLLFTDHMGRALAKGEDLEAHRSGLLKLSEIRVGEHRTRGIGGKGAVVVVRVRLVGTYGGTPFEGDFRYTRVWRRDPDGWRVAAAHCSSVA